MERVFVIFCFSTRKVRSESCLSQGGAWQWLCAVYFLIYKAENILRGTREGYKVENLAILAMKFIPTGNFQTFFLSNLFNMNKKSGSWLPGLKWWRLYRLRLLTAGRLMWTELLIIGCLSFLTNFSINKIIPRDNYPSQYPLPTPAVQYNHVSRSLPGIGLFPR